MAKYVGGDGLGAFLDGTYVPEAPAAAMLAFVQKPQVIPCADQIRDKIGEDRAQYGLPRWGSIWSSAALDVRLGGTWVTRHTRGTLGTSIAIYHSFLCCHGATPTPRSRRR